MKSARSFWIELASLANLIEHAPGPEEDRRREILATYMQCGPMGRETLMLQLQLVQVELANLQRMIVAEELPREDGKQTVTKARQDSARLASTVTARRRSVLESSS